MLRIKKTILSLLIVFYTVSSNEVHSAVTTNADEKAMPGAVRNSMQFSYVRILIDDNQHGSWGTGSFVEHEGKLFIATAAHCVEEVKADPKKPLRIVTGLFDVYESEAEGTVKQQGLSTPFSTTLPLLPSAANVCEFPGVIKHSGAREFSREDLKFHFSTSASGPQSDLIKDDWCLIEFLNPAVGTFIKKRLAFNNISLPILHEGAKVPDLTGPHFVCANTSSTKEYPLSAVSCTKEAF